MNKYLIYILLFFFMGCLDKKKENNCEKLLIEQKEPKATTSINTGNTIFDSVSENFEDVLDMNYFNGYEID